MNMNANLNEFTFHLAVPIPRVPGRGRITPPLWHAISGGATFNPEDDRLTELGWSDGFAYPGMGPSNRES